MLFILTISIMIQVDLVDYFYSFDAKSLQKNVRIQFLHILNAKILKDTDVLLNNFHSILILGKKKVKITKGLNCRYHFFRSIQHIGEIDLFTYPLIYTFFQLL